MKKSVWEKFLGAFLKKVYVFKDYAPVQDILAGQKYFNTIFFLI